MTLREELASITKANRTPTSVTNKIVKDMRVLAKNGEDSFQIEIKEEYAYKVMENLSNSECNVTCEYIDDNVYEISWA